MRWTCPKCGKKLDISNEQLIANDGVIVCPQCLLQARQPVPKSRGNDTTGTTPRKRQEQPSNNNYDSETPPEYRSTTPPPHKTRMKQASTSYRYTGLTGDSGTKRTTTKKPSSGQKRSKKKKKKSDGISGWGCLGRTIVFTLVLFAAYVFFGLLLETMQ